MSFCFRRYVKLGWLNRHFPDHEVIVELDNPNSIHALNRFWEEVHVEWRYKKKSLRQEELYTMGLPALHDDDEF